MIIEALQKKSNTLLEAVKVSTRSQKDLTWFFRPWKIETQGKKRDILWCEFLSRFFWLYEKNKKQITAPLTGTLKNLADSSATEKSSENVR